MSVIVKGHLIMPKDELRECKQIASNNQLSFPAEISIYDKYNILDFSSDWKRCKTQPTYRLLLQQWHVLV